MRLLRGVGVSFWSWCCLSDRGDLQNLAGMDQVRVTDLVAVRLEDRLPFLAIAVLLLGDFRETVSLLDGVLHLAFDRLVRWCRRSGRAAAADIGEVRARSLGIRHDCS